MHKNVEKLVYAVWSQLDREDCAAQLRGPVAGALTAAGARGVQITVDDDAVAEALVRLSPFDRPIAAMIFLWVDGASAAQCAALEAALGAVADSLAGYLVTESVPVPMPAAAPGARAPGFTNTALLRRPASMDFAHWRSEWQDRHTDVAIEVQGTFGYVQNLVMRAVTADAPELAAIVEEQFPDAATTDMFAFYGVDRSAPGAEDELRRRTAVMMDSVARFGANEQITVVPGSRYTLSSPFAAQD